MVQDRESHLMFLCIQVQRRLLRIKRMIRKKRKSSTAVILDEPGRRSILEEPEFRQVFECIRCGACLDVCPAFALVGGHVYGSKVYTGGIGIMLTHFLIDEGRASEIQSLCLQCGRCKEVCGGGLKITDMIRKIVKRMRKNIQMQFISLRWMQSATVNCSIPCFVSHLLLRRHSQRVSR